MEDCIFCKIVSGLIPSKEIYNDEIVKVFLDVNPSSKGHMLVIPKDHYENIFETDENVLAHINKICKKMAILAKDKLGAPAVNIVNASGKEAQQTVFHLHYHVVPRYDDDGLDIAFHGKPKLKDNLDDVKDILLK